MQFRQGCNVRICTMRRTSKMPPIGGKFLPTLILSLILLIWLCIKNKGIQKFIISIHSSVSNEFDWHKPYKHPQTATHYSKTEHYIKQYKECFCFSSLNRCSDITNRFIITIHKSFLIWSRKAICVIDNCTLYYVVID